jgi:hypothetical protein
MKIQLFTLIGLAALLTLNACRKERCDDPSNPDCHNYDPCYGVVGDASFRMMETALTTGFLCGGTDLDRIEVEVDTVNPGHVTFRANHEASSYEWRVGSDARRWTTREFELLFDSDVSGLDIPVTLVSKWTGKGTLACTGQTRVFDTQTKTIHINTIEPEPGLTQEYADALSYMFGKWQGYNEDDPDTPIEINIIFDLAFQFTGLFPECVNRNFSVFYVYRRHFFIRGGDLNCKQMCGVGYLKDDYKTMVFDYTYREGVGGEEISRTFIGTKMPE